MSTASICRRYTAQEYLAREDHALEKHEFHKGEIFLMAGGTPEHSVTKSNLNRIVSNALIGKPCVVYDADMRVKVAANGLYTYPDASIACPPIEFEAISGVKSLTNPVVLFEVMSPSSGGYDRGAKFNLYRELPSLKEYFLISHDRAMVERRARNAEGRWEITVADGLDSSVTVETISCILQLRQVYDKVELPTPFEETHESDPRTPPA